MSTPETADRERADLLQTLATQRRFLRQTARELTDEQAAQRTTVSELCVGGIIKHVAVVEQRWARFIVEGPAVFPRPEQRTNPFRPSDWMDTFRMLDGETLASLLDQYEQVAQATEKVVTDLPSLDADQPLPEAPWFPKGSRWSARRTLLHILGETSQHAGHADIIRESLDGAKTMG